MAEYAGWQTTGRELGRGGQGIVHLVRSPQKVRRLHEVYDVLRHDLNQIAGGRYDPKELAQEIVEIGAEDNLADLAALKLFQIPTGGDEERKAVGRLEAEVQALSNLQHNPAILKLLAASVNDRFIVTDYHPDGTLNKHLGRHCGDVLAALEAFRPLVAAVDAIHKHSMIHRDIKTENIFVARDGRLILGDFGIVFFVDGAAHRQTTTFEKVGTSYWMAPWAYKNERLAIEDIKPSLDIFPLAKVLWSMISGRNGLPFWWYDRDEYNLAKMFPDDPMMESVNLLLSKCIVDREENCMASAETMLLAVDQLIRRARNLGLGRRPTDDGPWPCRLCGIGRYEVKSNVSVVIHVTNDAERARLREDRFYAEVFACNHCGHIELFRKGL